MRCRKIEMNCTKNKEKCDVNKILPVLMAYATRGRPSHPHTPIKVSVCVCERVECPAGNAAYHNYIYNDQSTAYITITQRTLKILGHTGNGNVTGHHLKRSQ